MRKIILILLLTILALVPAALAEAGPAEPTVKVGIWTNQANIILSADSDFTLRDSTSKEVLSSFRAKEKVTVTVKDGRLTINGRPAAASEISLQLPDTAAATEVNRRQYRGTITVRRTADKSGLTVINTLPLEDYVYGIIAREISPAWPLEAVKAQAVAARTYALYNLGKHKDEGFDVCATIDCQVYGGKSAEDPRAIRAVNDTRGLVVTYQGKPIPAFFHGSGGGYTEHSENVWGTYHPFLRGVVDYDDKAPNYKWEKQMTPKEMEEALESAGYKLGTLQTIELSPLTKPPVTAADRGVSGRLKQVRLGGTAGSIQLSGAKLRTILGLNSTLFDVKVLLPTDKEVEFEITDSYGDREKKKVPIKAKPLPGKGLFADKPDIRWISGRSNEIIVFTGFGWGHGLGLSQWGAKAMAEKAPPGDTAYFIAILKHYYTGVDVQKLY